MPVALAIRRRRRLIGRGGGAAAACCARRRRLERRRTMLAEKIVEKVADTEDKDQRADDAHDRQHVFFRRVKPDRLRHSDYLPRNARKKRWLMFVDLQFSSCGTRLLLDQQDLRTRVAT